ncbi:hypothetical protein CRE_05440 [Caenorhabditis remanei]|uniref:G-protein coupled receptors family 1 profile domain-containing protein n=1 Tax=Caenorhabditis remanei TaxID=31234 RepID=E3M0J2_CAERE|nr:hypothetical protein CRE_05440 [Caenorhabditis remanei]
MIPFLFIIYSSVLVFSLLFLVFFFYTIKSYKQKGSIPTIYIYLMVFCNFVEIWMELCNDVMPVFLTKNSYDCDLKLVPMYVTLVDNLVYSYPLFLTILMVCERIYVLIFPFGRVFANKKLWWYCCRIATWTAIFVMTPFWKGCPVIFDYYSLTYVTECEHFVSFMILPLVRKTSRKHFQTEYLALSESTQRAIYYTRDSLVGLTCFFIYFVGTPAIRKIIFDRAFFVTTGRNKFKTVSVSAMI